MGVIKEKKRMRRMNNLEASDLRLVEVDVIQQILTSCFSVSMRKWHFPEPLMLHSVAGLVLTYKMWMKMAEQPFEA